MKFHITQVIQHVSACGATRKLWCAMAVFLLPLWVKGASPAIQFGSPAHYYGTNADGICAGDFNGDGRLDLATIANTSINGSLGVAIWTNAGAGAFVRSINYVMGDSPRAIAVGYINGDAYLDLATVNYPGDSVTAFLNNGTGSFTQASTSTSVNSVWAGLALGDVNGDGKLDAIVSNYGIKILLGNGSGYFTQFTNYNANTTYGVIAAHLNDDTNLDLITANYSSSSMSVYLGHGDGSFATATNYSGASSEYHYSVATGDFDNDGKLDLVTVNQYDSSASVRLNNGDGTFGGQSTNKTVPSAWSVQVADFNGDGRPDILTSGNSATVNLGILPNKGDGTFATALTNYTGVSGNFSKQAIAIGDFNEDGRLDIATIRGTNNAVTIRLNQSPATLRISSLTNGCRLDWPDWTNYVLESNTDLSDTNGWLIVNDSPVVLGTQKVLTNSPDGVRFYRLRTTVP